MKIFLVSNSSFLETIALISLRCINNRKDEYILLCENHDVKEDEIYTADNISICKNIDEAIQVCDISILYYNAEYSQNGMQKLINECNKYNKKLYKIDLSHNLLNSHYEETIIETNQRAPMIISLAVGRYHYQLRTELIIRNILKQLGVVSQQLFSPFATHLLKQYSLVLHDIHFENQLFNTKNKQIDVVSMTYSNFNELLSDNAIYKIMLKNNPVVVIIDVDASFNKMEELYGLFKFRFGSEIDIVVKSTYAQLSLGTSGNTKPIYFKPEKDIISNNWLIRSSSLYENIYQTIISKIAFPQGIKYINTL